MICWICKINVADSEEHKFKSSILRQAYGKKFKEDIILSLEGMEFLITSHKDRKVKFEKLICRDCNNVKTQSADDSYDIFIKYIENNYALTKERGYLNFSEIYTSGEEGKNNLYKYIAKLAGSRIYSFSEQLLPLNLGKFILGAEGNHALKLAFIQKEGIEILKWHQQHVYKSRFLHLANGSTVLYKSDALDYFHGWISYDWLTIHWFCGNFGEVANNDTIEKVVFQPFSVDGRDESIHIIDWIETYSISTDIERFEFIKTMVNGA